MIKGHGNDSVQTGHLVIWSVQTPSSSLRTVERKRRGTEKYRHARRQEKCSVVHSAACGPIRDDPVPVQVCVPVRGKMRLQLATFNLQWFNFVRNPSPAIDRRTLRKDVIGD